MSCICGHVCITSQDKVLGLDLLIVIGGTLCTIIRALGGEDGKTIFEVVDVDMLLLRRGMGGRDEFIGRTLLLIHHGTVQRDNGDGFIREGSESCELL